MSRRAVFEDAQLLPSAMEQALPSVWQPQLNSGRAVRSLMRRHVERAQAERREYFWALYLDTQLHLIDAPVVISIGTLNSTLVHPRDVFRFALERAAQRIVLVHNHPSNGCTPSAEDVALTKKLVNGGALINIPIADHVILTDDDWFSFAEMAPGVLQPGP